MSIEQFRYGPKTHIGLQFEQTDGVSQLLPEDKIIELYNIGGQTRKPLEIVRLHQTYFGPPVITVTFVQPAMDDNGRDTVTNRTFLISLQDITNMLLTALRPFGQKETEKLEPLEIGEFTISLSRASQRKH